MKNNNIKQKKSQDHMKENNDRKRNIQQYVNISFFL